MARHARVVLPGVPHHVYLRGNNRRRLFSSLTDRMQMLACLDLGLSATGCALHQLTLMTNHVHLIATPPDDKALSAFVKRACQRYAQQRNQTKQASGKLFEERFHSKPIVDATYLATVTLYNDCNAFRARPIADPLAHEWSTGPLHAGRAGSRIPASMWTPSRWYLGLGRSPASRATVYVELMAAYVGAGWEALVDDATEEQDVEYSRGRVERPDGAAAHDGFPQWVRKGE